MKAKQKFTEGQKREVAAALKSTRNKEEYQRVQAVWLRMTLNLRAADIAEVLGLHIGSVWRIHARFFREGSCIFTDKPHGGRYRENLTAAESRIRDVDMAKEMMNYQKNNILSQAATAMLAQANQQPQGVLQLLQ